MLLEAISLMKRDPALALPLLDEVDQALAPHADLADVRARTSSLLAAAALAAGELERAHDAAQSAMRYLRAQEDAEALQEVRGIAEQIGAELEQRRRAVVAKAASKKWLAFDLAGLEAESTSDLALADALIKHAGALRQHDRLDEALASAQRAVIAADASGAVREQVLARLTLAEVAPALAEQPLLQALKLADDASETTLVGMVARAATLAGVTLPAHHGPHGTPSDGSQPRKVE